MDIFILEDDETRINLFLEVLEGHTLTIRRGVEEAIRDFTPPYNLLLLDHDLGDLLAPTGLDFVRWLVDEDPIDLTEPDVIIHSWNPAGASSMLWTLHDRGWSVLQIPFGPTLLDRLRDL